jgi:hypothetical protein
VSEPDLPNPGPVPKEAIQALSDLFGALFNANELFDFMKRRPGCEWVAEDLSLMNYDKRQLCYETAYQLWEWRILRKVFFKALRSEHPERADAIVAVAAQFGFELPPEE